MSEYIIETKNIKFAYDKLQILNNINFQAEKNKKLLLIGPNGAGKSTLLKVLAGLLKQQKGQILFNNNDISKQNYVSRVKSGIVYLQQDKVIFPGLTISENLDIAGYFLKKNILNNKKEKIYSMFEELKNIQNKRAGLLSGGQKQILGIAMIMMKSPKLLLLDEPTAGLSPAISRYILDKIMQSIEKENTDIIMIEHNLAIVLEYVDTVKIMIQGQVEEKTFNASEIKQNPHILDKYYFY